ncbi:unnamed protein product [Phytophthora lilii]|uniref:Unnamed protein product n=1 Tax=Phytophthora lilii TaxID=2077276 RepID=A0A9W6TRV4_9STRA|nr:unnamed protein product [Phytophthora lilii]
MSTSALEGNRLAVPPGFGRWNSYWHHVEGAGLRPALQTCAPSLAEHGIKQIFRSTGTTKSNALDVNWQPSTPRATYGLSPSRRWGAASHHLPT